MRLPTYLYLGGMLLLLVGERILTGGESTARYVVDAVGVLSVLAALGAVGQGLAAAAADQKAAHRDQLIFGAVGLGSLLVYLLSTDAFIDTLSLSEDAEYNTVSMLQALWPIVWLSGTLPFLAVDRALFSSPTRIVPERARESAMGWLSAAFLIAAMFPINYVAMDMNHRWDLGYFKTAEPGTATMSMVESLDTPVTAYLFFRTSSDVTSEIRTYFDKLPPSEGFSVEYVDHALEPELSQDLKIRDNGYIVLVRGEGDDRQVERIKIGATFDAARRNLKKLDAELYEGLLQIARGPRTAYLVVGHGEMYWGGDEGKERRIADLKKAFEGSNFDLKTLGLAEGLADEVPEDASLVLVLAPTEPYLDEEIASLGAYRRRGGKLFVALDPFGEPLDGLLEPMGARFDPDRALAIDQGYIPLSRGPMDRLNIATSKFSTHESVTTLSRNSDTLPVFTPAAGVLSESKDTAEEGVRTNVTVRAPEQTWADGNRNLTPDSGEVREAYPIAIAASGPASEGEGEFRAVITGDATWLSDLSLSTLRVQGNRVWVNDSIAWLLEDEAAAGTVNDEKDVKIKHTSQNQGWIFYSTTLFVPLSFLLAGLLRVRSRKKRS